MDIVSILANLRRNKLGAMLIVIQLAITLAILCNAVFIIQRRLAITQRPTGVEERNILTLSNEWIGAPPDLTARVQSDLATLRALPGVVDAYVSNTYPLSNGGNAGIVILNPGQRFPSAFDAVYLADDHALNTLGVRLIAGRNFRPEEVTALRDGEPPHPAAVIITRALARTLYPDGTALGRSIFVGPGVRVPIIGIIDKLQVPWTSASGFGSTFSNNSMLQPLMPVSTDANYIVRARPGQLAAVLRSAPIALYKLNRARVLKSVQSLSDSRRDAYRDDQGFALILIVVSMVMLLVTALGIVGLTSYWVVQRRQQIGIRRALGATRGAVIAYVQSENLLIAVTAVAIGFAIAIGLSLWATSKFELPKLPSYYPILGCIILLFLGQCAALWPALRASLIPPAVATRST